MKIASWLKEQKKVTDVYYVGLPEHPGYEINQKQSRGAGSMISCSGSAKCRCSGRKGWGRDAFRRTGAPHGPLSSGKSSLFFEAVAVGGAAA